MSGRLDEFDGINWDFKEAKTNLWTANIHPYHAKFIPQIPQHIIKYLTDDKDDTILDMFNGCGTTSMVSLVEGRESVGIDANPLACLIAKAKTTPIPPEELGKKKQDFLEKARRRVEDVRSNSLGESKILIPDFPDKEHWYHPQVLNEMGAIFHLIQNEEDKDIRRLFKVSFSAITKAVCRSDEDYTYIGDNMFPDSESNKLTPNEKKFDVYSHFERKMNDNVESLKSLYKKLEEEDLIDKIRSDDLRNEIRRTDSKNMTGFLEDGEIDLAVTSPPYPNAVDYARYHRLSFYWLGHDVSENKKEEIGARAKRGRRTAIEDYFKEMKEVIRETNKVLSDNSFFCVVIGDSQHNNNQISASKRITKIAEDEGFELQKKFIRNLHKQSMSQKNITREKILFLKKS